MEDFLESLEVLLRADCEPSGMKKTFSPVVSAVSPYASISSPGQCPSSSVSISTSSSMGKDSWSLPLPLKKGSDECSVKGLDPWWQSIADMRFSTDSLADEYGAKAFSTNVQCTSESARSLSPSSLASRSDNSLVDVNLCPFYADPLSSVLATSIDSSESSDELGRPLKRQKCGYNEALAESQWVSPGRLSQFSPFSKNQMESLSSEIHHWLERLGSEVNRKTTETPIVSMTTRSDTGGLPSITTHLQANVSSDAFKSEGEEKVNLATVSGSPILQRPRLRSPPSSKSTEARLNPSLQSLQPLPLPIGGSATLNGAQSDCSSTVKCFEERTRLSYVEELLKITTASKAWASPGLQQISSNITIDENASVEWNHFRAVNDKPPSSLIAEGSDKVSFESVWNDAQLKEPVVEADQATVEQICSSVFKQLRVAASKPSVAEYRSVMASSSTGGQRSRATAEPCFSTPSSPLDWTSIMQSDSSSFSRRKIESPEIVNLDISSSLSWPDSGRIESEVDMDTASAVKNDNAVRNAVAAGEAGAASFLDIPTALYQKVSFPTLRSSLSCDDEQFSPDDQQFNETTPQDLRQKSIVNDSAVSRIKQDEICAAATFLDRRGLDDFSPHVEVDGAMLPQSPYHTKTLSNFKVCVSNMTKSSLPDQVAANVNATIATQQVPNDASREPANFSPLINHASVDPPTSSSDASNDLLLPHFEPVDLPADTSKFVNGQSTAESNRLGPVLPFSAPFVSSAGYHNTSNLSTASNADFSLDEGFQGEDGQWYKRPDVDDACLEQLCNLSELREKEPHVKLFVNYKEAVNFPLGEGGRELLRACLNAKGCKGRRLQGASVPMLLRLAEDWGLWNVAVRIKVERATGELCAKHEAFVRFKAMQSHLRKFLKREQMHTERDVSGRITHIRFEEMKSLTLGKEGREKLRTQLRRLHDRDPVRMDSLLEQYGFKYSELRNATVPQLLKMAHICCMWNEVIDACKHQEAKRDTKTNGKKANKTNQMEDSMPNANIPHNANGQYSSLGSPQLSVDYEALSSDSVSASCHSDSSAPCNFNLSDATDRISPEHSPANHASRPEDLRDDNLAPVQAGRRIASY